MAKTMIASPVLSDAATLTVSGSASSTLGKVNLQSLNPRQYWRSSTDTPHIVIDLGSAADIRLVSVLYGNFVQADTWRVRGATSEANLTSSPGYDSGSVSAWPDGADLSSWDRTHTRLYLSTAETFQWWRIDFDASSNSDGYVEAGRLYVSEGIQPATGVSASKGWEPSFVEPSARTLNQSGGVTPRGFPQRRNVALALINLTRAEAWGSISVFRRDRGASGDVLALIDPEESTYPMDHMYYGLLGTRLSMPNAFLAKGGDPRYSVTVEIEEP